MKIKAMFLSLFRVCLQGLHFIIVFWSRLPAMLRSLGYWMMLVGGASMILAIIQVEKHTVLSVMFIIAVLGFALGYLFCAIDWTDGFGEDQAEAMKAAGRHELTRMDDGVSL